MLFACVFVPCFAVQASLRCEPQHKIIGWSSRPVAVLDGPETLPRVYACNERARIAGIEIGCTKTQAGQCPGIILRKRDPKQEQSAHDALIDCSARFSPRVESTHTNVVTLDIAGTEGIFGPTQNLLRMLADSAGKVGLEVNVAAASNADTALLAAKGFNGITVIAKGNEADALAQLPVDVLPLNPTQAEVLDSWGIRKFRDLTFLPPVPLVERLGQAGLHLQRLARGETSRTLVPLDPPLQFKESLELENPVEDLGSLMCVLDRLLEQISSRLSSRSLATDELRVRLGLEIREDRDLRKEPKKNVPQFYKRTLRLPVSMQDTRVLLKLLHLDLEKNNPGAAVKTVSIEARPAKQRYTQGGLFAALAPEPEKLEVTLARIRGVVGETDAQGRQRVGSPQMLDSNKPDDFRVVSFAYDSKSFEQRASDSTSLAMNMFRPPLPARVRCQGGKPVHISFAEFDSPILCASGPWLTSGNWWKKAEQWRREEWDIAIGIGAGVGLYRIFRDVIEDAWFVEGLYD